MPVNEIVKEILLDYDNIKKYYDPDEDDNYPHEFFNNDEEILMENYWKFRECVKDYNENVYELLFKMLPDVLEYADDVGMKIRHITIWFLRGSYHPIFGTYALKVAEEIMGEYDEYITNLYYIPRKLAISKLKRNRIVNEGILLKLSMKNCGMF